MKMDLFPGEAVKMSLGTKPEFSTEVEEEI
jgi:hypothetical protein